MRSDRVVNYLFPLWVLLILLVTGTVLAQAPEPGYRIYLPVLHTAPAWTTERVDAPRYFGDLGARALAHKGPGQPCMVYGNDHLYYACWTGGRWDRQVVDLDMGTGRYAALALDGSRNPHIAYYDELNGRLKYAFWNGAGWSIETVDEPALPDSAAVIEARPELDLGADVVQPLGVVSQKQGLGGFPSLALDSSGQARVSYYDYTHQDLKYAVRVGGRWQASIIDSAGDAGQYSSLALSPAGEAAVAYYDALAGDLKLARQVGTGWTVTLVDTSGDVGRYASLAFNRAGQPRIAYYDAGGRRLKYWEGGSPQVVLGALPLGQFASLRLDEQDRPWIGCFGEQSADLVLVHRDSSGIWQYQAVDSYDFVGRSASLDFDSAGVPALMYYHSSNNELRYAVADDEAFNLSVVDVTTYTGVYVAMALSDLQPRIVYLNDSQSRLMYAYQENGQWRREVISALNDTGIHPALAVGANGASHVTFWQYHGGTPDGVVSSLRYLSRGASGWSDQQIVDEGLGMGWHSDIALDAQGRLHASYYDEDGGNLKYAVNSGAGWTAQVVDGAGNVGNYTSLALDAAGLPWISYTDVTNGDLKAAHYTGASWQIWRVDSPGSVGLDTSLALDPSGSPVIAYRDETNGRIKLARKTGSGWTVEAVDSVGRGPSLAVDPAGRVLVSYYDDHSFDLKFAFLRDGKWNYEVIDQAGDVGMFSALALGRDGRCRVAYFDVTNGDLKFAEREYRIP